MSSDSSSSNERFVCTVEGCDRAFDTEQGMCVHRGISHPEDLPWKDHEALKRLYVDEELSEEEIANRWGCGSTTIGTQLEKANIESRGVSEAKIIRSQKKPAPLFTDNGGYERWVEQYRGDRNVVLHHRLLAVAEYGFDAVCGKVVHHGPIEIEWANWEDNIELVNLPEHTSHHQSGHNRQLYSDDELLSELRRLNEACDGIVSHTDMIENGKYSVPTYYNRFGSWGAALEKAEIGRVE